MLRCKLLGSNRTHLSTLVKGILPAWAVMLPLVLGCVSESSQETSFLLSRIDTPDIANIRQLNGSPTPQYIVDVKSTGMALLDLHGDGKKSLLLTCGSNLDRWNQGLPGFPPLLFQIDDKLNLSPIEDCAGISSLRWTSSCAAADIDGDGDDDLLLTGLDGSLLLENVNGQFRPILDSGIKTTSWCTSAAFGDLDLDGDLDLFICRYLEFPFESPPLHGEEWSCLWENSPVLCGPRGLPPQSDLVFENLGDWKFIDRSVDWGFDRASPGYGLAVTIMNLFGDPHPEIVVANDSCPNHMWTRNEDAVWVEDGLLSGLGVDQDGQEQAGMGIALAGVAPPEGLDVVITNFERESVNLYVNENEGTYRDISSSTGLSALTRSSLGWGTGIADFNLDGLADIMICNGHVYPEADFAPVSPGYRQMDQLLLGRLNPETKLRFEDAGSLIQDAKKHLGRCLILADLDDDGDVDAITSSLNGAPHIYRNNTNPRSDKDINSVSVNLVQTGENRQGIGSTIRLLNANRPLSLPVLRQSSFQSSGDACVILPLNNDSDVKLIQVTWPDNSIENFPVTQADVILRKGHGQKP